MTAPYHPGELAVQELAGETTRAQSTGRVIADRIPAGAIPFLERQTMLVVGTVDARLTPWVSLLFGPPGFVRSDAEGRTVLLDVAALGVDPPARDAALGFAAAHLARDPRLGILAIELASRRRLRVNGRASVALPEAGVVTIQVDEAYPNCPRFIQRRNPSALRELGTPSVITRDVLSTEDIRVVSAADTLFVASLNPAGHADASHRGGPPGFVEVLAPDHLRVPDYAGNSMFNTLGNLHTHPRAGLAFLDFDQGTITQVTGAVTLDFDAADPDAKSGGTGRFWDLHIDAVRVQQLATAPAWEFLDASPDLPE